MQNIINEHKNEYLGEKYFEIDHFSGLKIFIMPQNDKSTISAMFGAKFGAMNNAFTFKDGKKVEVIDGTAHFLEHKLFEGEKGNAFDFYAKTGAKANAYTSNDKTVYYFSCSSDFDKNLDILLSYIQNPYLNDENVEKEKGIIAQEIKMYEDDPFWCGYLNLINCLYVSHPIKIDVAGKVEDIMKITVSSLLECHRAYYNLSNMALCVAGNVSVDEVLKICDEKFKFNKKEEIIEEKIVEPSRINTEFKTKEMLVSKPIFFIGIKDNNVNEKNYLKNQVATNILLKMIFSKSFSLYKKMYNEGLINSSFEFEYESNVKFGFALFTGESEKPKEVYNIIKSECNKFLKSDFDEEKFITVKNSMYGQSVSLFDNVNDIINTMIDAYFNGCRVFDEYETIKNITKDDILNAAKKLFKNDNFALSIIIPKEDKNA